MKTNKTKTTSSQKTPGTQDHEAKDKLLSLHILEMSDNGYKNLAKRHIKNVITVAEMATIKTNKYICGINHQSSYKRENPV